MWAMDLDRFALYGWLVATPGFLLPMVVIFHIEWEMMISIQMNRDVVRLDIFLQRWACN